MAGGLRGGRETLEDRDRFAAGRLGIRVMLTSHYHLISQSDQGPAQWGAGLVARAWCRRQTSEDRNRLPHPDDRFLTRADFGSQFPQGQERLAQRPQGWTVVVAGELAFELLVEVGRPFK